MSVKNKALWQWVGRIVLFGFLIGVAVLLGACAEDKPAPTPGIDTMEFRRSDRTWNDCGPPFQL